MKHTKPIHDSTKVSFYCTNVLAQGPEKPARAAPPPYRTRGGGGRSGADISGIDGGSRGALAASRFAAGLGVLTPKAESSW